MRISDWSSDVCSSDLVAVAQRLLAHFERTALGLPLGEPAIEQRDIVRAEQIQEPPGARRALQRAVVVKHDANGRASSRERGCQYVLISVAAVSYKKKTSIV